MSSVSFKKVEKWKRSAREGTITIELTVTLIYLMNKIVIPIFQIII